MRFVLPIFCAGSALSILSSELYLKKVGFFIVGLLHIKSTICYQHSYELMPAGWNSIAATVINVFDCLTLFIVCVSLKYLTHDIEHVFIGLLSVSLICSLLYLLLIPESPRWLFMMEGPTS